MASLFRLCTSRKASNIILQSQRTLPTLSTMQNSKMNMSSDKKSPIRAVIFDMGGVMITAPMIAWADFERRHGLQNGSIMETIRMKEILPLAEAMDRGEISVEEFEEIFTKHYMKKTQLNFPKPLPFISEWEAMMPNSSVSVMFDAVRSLKTNGIKTGLLTNNFFLDRTKKRSLLPLVTSLFDHVVESCRIGMRKPDPKCYQYMLDSLQCQPHETAFLDDIGENVKAARDMGMKTVKVNPHEPAKAVQELEQIVGMPLMHPGGIGPVRKGMEIDTDKLAVYLKDKLQIGSGKGEAIEIRQYKHGQSNPTYFMRIGDKKLVLRKKPAGKLLESAHMVEREYRVMKAVAQHGVPVPKVLDLCTDNQIIGTPFYLMDVVDGRIFLDPSLPELTPRQRREVYTAMNEVLCKIHSVNIQAAGLNDYGKTENYIERQIGRWLKQYEASKTHEIPNMDKLIDWLKSNVPKSQGSTLVHGDFRLDNLIYHPMRAEVLAVLDWELSTLGDPITDLATCCLAYYLPSSFPLLKGFSDRLDELPSLGIPKVDEFVNQYARRMNVQISPEMWNFYIAFICFRFAAILQGVYKRSQHGQASGANASAAGKLAEFFVQIGWKQSQQPHSLTTVQQQPSKKEVKMGVFPTVPSSLPERSYNTYLKVKQFIHDEVEPLENEFLDYAQGEQKWQPNPVFEKLREKAKSQGLWNLFMPLKVDPDRKYGAGFTNVEYAHMCELMGRSLFAPEVFNCQAPDTGNMEVLAKYGNAEQRSKWLTPLLEGKIRSCFAMTEPAVASSDATNIEASIKRDGSDYVLNGRKWFITGAMDPRCELCIFMGKTDPNAPIHEQQSMIIVPMNTPGIKIIRPLSTCGFLDAPGGHAEIEFYNVRVHVSNLILGAGRGFEIAQGRLGPGRIHHCMRLIGMAEYALKLMCKRAIERTAFKKRLAGQGVVQADIAKSRIEIEQARLLVLKAAHMMDTVGAKESAKEIAMIKVIAPQMAMNVLDRAIQVHGAKGLSGDTMLAMMYVWARALRIADGPDEVHLAAIARKELKSYLDAPASHRGEAEILSKAREELKSHL